MAKKRSTSNPSQSPKKRPQVALISTQDSFWGKHQRTIIAIGSLYLLLAVFFAPVVLQNQGLTPAPDMMAVAGMNKMGEEAIKDFKFPLWNPTLYCGLPLFASLQYALFTYPPEFFIRVLSYIFGISPYRVWIFHYFLAGIFAFLLARHYKCGRLASWLTGVGYAFSPQLIVLVDVGHGSKLMGMVYLPLIWLLLDRLRRKPTYGRAAALGAVFAVEILSLHPQVAAYGGMMMGLYLIYYGLLAFKRGELLIWGKTALLWCGSLILSLAISAVLWISVLDYARYSIRGAGAAGLAGGGVDWSYATGWSFHPLESLTLLFPNWFGFSGGTYWGTVGTPDGTPFTQNPMYFGIVVVLLAVLAIATIGKKRWGFPVTLGLAGLILSFGRYLPILYGPLYHLLPLFNKFRAPVMSQILLLLAASLLAGLGLQWLIDRLKQNEASPRLLKILFWVGAVAAVQAALVLIAPGVFHAFYTGISNIVPSQADPRVVAAAEVMARTDVMRVLGLIALLSVLSAFALQKKIPSQLLLGVFLIVFLTDLFPINRKLVNFEPLQRQQVLLEPEGVVKRLQRDEGKFRIHALDQSYPAIYWQRKLGVRSNVNPANWLSYWGFESTAGYFGAKPAPFQKLMSYSGLDANAPYSWHLLFTRPQLLDALNVRYILTTVPLDMAFEELQKQGLGDPIRPAKAYSLEFMPREIKPGAGAFLYRNPGELPRVRFVDSFRVIEDFDQTLTVMLSEDWNPAQEVLLERDPGLKSQSGGNPSVQMVIYEPELIKIKTEAQVAKILVLADSYYPSGWTAAIDGQKTPIIRADGVLRAIAVPAGEHEIIFAFRPTLFYLGLGISVISVVILLGWFIFWIKSRSKTELTLDGVGS